MTIVHVFSGRQRGASGRAFRGAVQADSQVSGPSFVGQIHFHSRAARPRGGGYSAQAPGEQDDDPSGSVVVVASKRRKKVMLVIYAPSQDIVVMIISHRLS